jgi:hypothetical protein
MHYPLTLALLLGAGACSGDTAGPGPDLRPDPRQVPVALSTDATQYARGGSGVLRVSNQSTETLTHGVCPTLERREGDRWAAVDEQAVCIQIAVLLQPGETYEHRFAAPNAPGVYRYSWEFYHSEPDDAGNTAVTAASNPFTVVP